MHRYRYGRWDGTQSVFPITEDDVLDNLSDHLMRHGDLASALRSLAQRGLRTPTKSLSGLQDFQQRLRQRRQEMLDRYNLSGVLGGIREKLNEVKRLEQEGLAQKQQDAQQRLQEMQQTGQGGSLQADLLRKLDDLVQKNQERIQSLPQEPAAAINQLREYEFMDPRARERFNELMSWLQQRMVDAAAQEMSRRMQDLSPQDMDAIKRMARDLNDLLENARADPEAFQRFMQKHGQLFGSNKPASLQELVERLQDHAAQVEALLNSMTADQKRQIQQALQAAFNDQELARELFRLAANLAALQPGHMRREYPFRGQESLDMDGGLDVIHDLQRMDEAERQIKRAQQSGNLAEVDQDLLTETLGDDARRNLQQLEELTKMLEEAGYVAREGDMLKLTPKGVRQLGIKAMREVFSFIKQSRPGDHITDRNGSGADLSDGAKKYEFGDPLALDLPRTIFNAVARGESDVPIRLQPDDFEVHRTTQQQRSTTVLMLDLSLSMAMRGNFVSAKKVAMALDMLIRTQYPRDTLYVIGFSTYAREIKPERLAYLGWDEFDPYTNIQHGLALAQKLLDRVNGGTKQIIMVSDGEPTAHMEEGRLFLQYPPSPRTVRETLREVKRCTGRGIIINTFMLDRSAQLVEFVSQMTRINRGRVFYTSPDHLGEYVLVDYMTSRRRVLTT
jgi:uncharacterized protein with von Willebrand factor type A (vWA) domain